MRNRAGGNTVWRYTSDSRTHTGRFTRHPLTANTCSNYTTVSARQVALIVTSPPYGPSTHGQVSTGAGGIHKRDHLYGNVLDRGNLANIGHHRLLAGFTRILSVVAGFLRPGGHVVITVRPWREHAELIDLPAQIQACGRHVGLLPVERCVALLGRVTDSGGFVARGRSFNVTSSAVNGNAGYPCTSSPTKTSSS